MFLALGVKVTYLKRIQFGNFTLDPDLATGDCRPLNQEELGLLKIFEKGKALKIVLFFLS